MLVLPLVISPHRDQGREPRPPHLDVRRVKITLRACRMGAIIAVSFEK